MHRRGARDLGGVIAAEIMSVISRSAVRIRRVAPVFFQYLMPVRYKSNTFIMCVTIMRSCGRPMPVMYDRRMGKGRRFRTRSPLLADCENLFRASKERVFFVNVAADSLRIEGADGVVISHPTCNLDSRAG